MAHCGFKTGIEYLYEKTGIHIPYVCPEPEENILDNGLCIFHSGDYLKDQVNKEVNERNIRKKLTEKIKSSEPLICIGYYLPAISFEKLELEKSANFTAAQFMGRADFSGAQFMGRADFSGAQFLGETNFTLAQFTKEADFSGAQFLGETNFTLAQFTKEADFNRARFREKADLTEVQSYSHLNFKNVQFDDQEHVIFLKNNLSEASFLYTDITRVRFGEDVVWGENFKIREEREIENQLKTKSVVVDIQMGEVLAVYRNLRENYEFRMRYGEAGEFFIREMEMNRLYKQDIKNEELQIRRNNLIIQNFSLAGLYYHLSRYGQSFSRPALFGTGIVLFSTLLWLTQPNAAGDFSVYNITTTEINNSTNLQLAFERSLTNFLPSLSFGTELNVGLLDVAFKIVGGAVTFGLIIIALRRKFERKFRH